jgi:hypothetical protein
VATGSCEASASSRVAAEAEAVFIGNPLEVGT